MYGKLVTSKTTEVLVEVKQSGDRINVCVDDKVVAIITKKQYDEPVVHIVDGVKYVVDKESEEIASV